MPQELQSNDLVSGNSQPNIPGSTSTEPTKSNWFFKQPSTIKGRHIGVWLSSKFNDLYKDPAFARANSDVQSYYKKQAYNKWVVPYFNHIGKEVPLTEEEFLAQKDLSKYDWKTGSILKDVKAIQNEQIEKAYKDSFGEPLGKRLIKTGLAINKQTDKTISGIVNLLATITEPIATPEESIQLQALKRFKPGSPETAAYQSRLNQKLEDRRQNSLYGKFKTSEEYWDNQAVEMENRIQDLGGHTLQTRIAELGTQVLFFEATGASKASEALRFANPKTADYATKLLKAEWNGAVTGLFYGASSGTKAKDLHDDMTTFMLFGAAGTTGTKMLQFLKTFGKVTTPEVAKTVITSTAKKLLTGEGVSIPSEESLAKATPEVNQQAAEAGIAHSLNSAALALYSQEIKSGLGAVATPEINEAFKKLTPQQQKNVITRLFGALSDAHNVGKFDLSQALAPTALMEEEAKIAQVVPAAQKIQQFVDNYVKQSGADPIQAKIGAILPHHNTTEDSPIAHVAARMSWLRRQAENPDITAAQRFDFKSALEDESKLYKQIKTRLRMKDKNIQ